MKKFLVFLAAISLVFGVVGTASALPFTDTYGPVDILLNAEEFVEWQFDLTDDGFNHNIDIIESGTIGINFYWAGKTDEYVTVTFSPNMAGQVFSFEADNGWWNGELTFFDSLQNNGKSMVRLASDQNSGPVKFLGATLDVNTVPEPATMLLLGSGLIGLGIFGRKKFFKK